MDVQAARAQLQAWRDQADASAAHAGTAVAPARLAFLEALARRTQAHAGAARALLEARLVALVQDSLQASAASPMTVAAAHASTMPAPASGAAAAGDAPDAACATARLDVWREEASGGAGPVASPAAAPGALGVLAHRCGARRDAATDAYPELPLVGQARVRWAQLRTGSQLRQSLAQVPADAGPLNSGVLVHRAITLMRDVSPGYLQHFIAYLDTLSSLQRLRDARAPAREPASPGEAARPVKAAKAAKAAKKRVRR